MKSSALNVFELSYRSTFIDVTEGDLQNPPTVRSQSCPPETSSDQLADIHYVSKELATKGYVNELNNRKGLTRMKPPVRDQEEVPVDGPASKNDEGGGPGVALRAVNPGTLGHPHVCRRRCVHLSRGNCRQGANCGYCHLDHTRVTKLDKKHRAMLDELPKGVLMLTVLHFLRLNAEEHDLLPWARPLIQMCEEEAAALGGTHKRYQRLDTFLSRMSFGAILSLASHRMSDTFQQRVAEAEQDIREALPQTPLAEALAAVPEQE